MKKGDKKFIVVWNNPRTIEEVEYEYMEKGFHRVKVLSDGSFHWRRAAVIFDTKEDVDKYLEIEDYRSIH